MIKKNNSIPCKPQDQIQKTETWYLKNHVQAEMLPHYEDLNYLLYVRR